MKCLTALKLLGTYKLISSTSDCFLCLGDAFDSASTGPAVLRHITDIQASVDIEVIREVLWPQQHIMKIP